jgi:prepilin-type N-terminal cleavage/methylation domain-containing protein
MRNRGFTLVEVLVTLVIMGVLLAVATHNWSVMQQNSAVESQIKTLYADLMEIRLQALYSKTPRKVVFSGKLFKIYSSATVTSTPLITKTFRYPIVVNLTYPANTNVTLTFDAQGLMNGNERSICVLPTNDTLVVNPAATDSLVISQARINLGKRTEGDCDSDNINQK